MSLETGTTISDLDSSWPLGGDSTSDGDDHIRLIKSVLKTQFPGSSGDGFSIPITATEQELNYLVGTTSNIQDALDNLASGLDGLVEVLNAPSGTRMVFIQASAPFGWVQDTSLNDYAFRIVSGPGGGTGGSDSPFTASFDHTHTTNAHTLTISEMPSHKHSSLTANDSNTVVVNELGKRFAVAVGTNPLTETSNIQYTGGGAPHSHGDTGSVSLPFTPRYINSIIGVKS